MIILIIVPAAEQSLTTSAFTSAPAGPPAPVFEPFSLSLNEALPTDVPVSVTTEPFTPAAKPSSIPVPKPSPVPEPASTLPPCMFFARGHYCRAGQLCNYPHGGHVGRSLHNPLTRHPPVNEQTAEVKVPALATTYVPDVDPSSSSSVPTLSSYLGSGASDVRPGTPRTVHLHPDRSDS